jgi:hypothetical protein
MTVEIVHSPDVDLRRLAPAAGDVDGDVAARVADRADEMIDAWGRDSFPASDPPSNW